MEDNIWKEFFHIFNIHKGKIVGALIGFLFGILILYVGFFKTLLIFACTLLGYYIGSRWDLAGDFKELLDRLLPQQYK
ncbi:MAG: DUF2273 domain-containing protein [Halothermotrichaceae bacterium]